MALQDYDIIPKEMRSYLRNNGRHFNKKACDWAVSKMKHYNKATNKKERIQPLGKTDVDSMLERNNVKIENAKGYDYVYIANMCKADFWGSSIVDELHMSLYIKDVCDDVDASEGQIFNRWIADMDSCGDSIDWEELI